MYRNTNIRTPAITPGTRPGPKSATTGTRYTNAGMVCIASSNGLSACWNRSLRADDAMKLAAGRR